MKKLFFIILSLSIVMSCSYDEQLSNINISNDFTDVTIISQEQALANLRSFMDSVEGDMPQTKSGERRQIGSIDTYYIANHTKSAECIPAAYVVNFENNEGFAVLGANSNVADIVAVTESGNIDPVTFAIRDSIDVIDPIIPFDPFDPIIDDEDSVPSDFDWYCEEDDDFYICSPADPSPLRNYLMLAVHTIDGTDGSASGGNDSLFPGDGDSGSGGNANNRPYYERTKLINTNWNQGDWQVAGVYNKYCVKSNGKIAYAGCSITAASMMIAYNRYPQTLRVNGTTLNYTRMTEYANPDYIDSQYREHISLLMGGLFNNIDRLFAFNSGTCVTPRQIELFMETMGYTNVVRHCASSFNQTILSNVSSMLRNNLPVFVSAFRGVASGHSWVLDGGIYTDNDNYCLHCNWGWGGLCNGYFSYTCFQPGSPIISDGNGGTDNGGAYDSRFRVITYNKPSTSITRTLNF